MRFAVYRTGSNSITVKNNCTFFQDETIGNVAAVGLVQ